MMAAVRAQIRTLIDPRWTRCVRRERREVPAPRWADLWPVTPPSEHVGLDRIRPVDRCCAGQLLPAAMPAHRLACSRWR